VARVASQNGWPDDWLNDAVSSFLSPLAHSERDLVFLGTFPRATEHAGLRVLVPSARYMLALKLKALRVSKYEKGTSDLADVASLLGVLNIKDAEGRSPF
jgi:hypothetical protein